LAEGTAASADGKAPIVKLRKRLGEIAAIDFFGANGREPVEGLLNGLEQQMRETAMESKSRSPSHALAGLVWVTREGVHIDRIACSWLIRRFIDVDAKIRFVPGKSYTPRTGEVRFDMFEGEYTHEGDRCSFEVILARAGLRDAALQTIAEIVHDIDLKDAKFGRDEAAGIANLIAGIAMSSKCDEERIARGSAVFDDLYEYHLRKSAQGK
jgi:hypothetical protein